MDVYVAVWVCVQLVFAVAFVMCDDLGMFD